MIAICPKVSRAFTLIELMVAVTVIAIAAVGGLEYQYYAVKHSRIAHSQITAARTAQLLLEDWKSVGGSTTYNPINLQLGFAASSIPSGFTMGLDIGDNVLNSTVYTITVNNVPMVIMLCYKQQVDESTVGKLLKPLTVMVRWKQVGIGGNSLCDLPVILTTYVRL
jgi:prepilin-type N-terminal cleavage/methylation domain-containing protein